MGPCLARNSQPLSGCPALQVTIEMLNNQSIAEMTAINQAIMAEGRMDVGASISSEMLKRGNTQFMEVRPAPQGVDPRAEVARPVGRGTAELLCSGMGTPGSAKFCRIGCVYYGTLLVPYWVGHHHI